MKTLQFKFPLLNEKEQMSAKGGWGVYGGYDPNYWNNDPGFYAYLGEVVVSSGGSSYNYPDPYTWGTQVPFMYNDYYNNSGGYGGSGVASGSPTFSSSLPIMDLVTISLSNGLAWHEYYTGFEDVVNGIANPFNVSTVMDALFTKNPAALLVSDIKDLVENGQFNGIKILNVTGQVLGVTQAVGSAMNLMNKLIDPTVDATWEDYADAGISVGSLFIRSSFVGFAVSGGWFLVQSYFGE